MLQKLYIENYTLIKSLYIVFDEHFTTITGETGAGKSIILGALSLIIGGRADTNVLFNKSAKCIVEGEFNIKDVNFADFFEKNNLDYDINTIIRREISETGKSRSFINDTPVTLSCLKEFASCIIDIHSQHQNLLINNQSFRIGLIDQFAANKNIFTQYSSLYNQFSDISKKIVDLQISNQKDILEKDYLLYLYNELKESELDKIDQLQLETEIATINNTAAIKNQLHSLTGLISENENNISSQLKTVKKELESLSVYGEHYKNMLNNILEVIVTVDELSYETSKMLDNISVEDKNKLELLQQQLDHIYFLQQKHHANTIEELIIKRDELAKKLIEIENREEELNKLKITKEHILSELQEKSELLTDSRSKILPVFEYKIIGLLKMLSMPDARFEVRLNRKTDFSNFGIDDIDFYFSSNQGIELDNITKIASGGELSRIVFAIKSTITQTAMLPTIIFDEIDTGISGETATKEAMLMFSLSKVCQLITITHLPQIAAKGHKQLFVYKEIVDNMTRTSIRELSQEERVVNIAKMISGDTVSNSALQTAKELLN